ncbi:MULTISPECIES: ImmA/IrrE family metallo-endopeptidase [Polaromonas]|uniref:ImmA/IrrE family metallo-endopeptidase n=1 Tax=Polaromonas aquatica TaxID=332657 RepID=A0ABW1U1G2_9BURK
MTLLHDDFPLSPDCWADGVAYYKAFLRADSFLAGVPKKAKDANSDRQLYELTAHLLSSTGQQDALFRAKLGAPETLIAVWLTKIRTLAEWFTVAENIPPFTGLNAEHLNEIVKLSSDVSKLADVGPWLLKHGIVLIHEPGLAGMNVDGAVFKIASGNPVVGLSLRFPRVDHYWFTLMHELAHVVLHAEMLFTPIVDDFEQVSAELVERQADKLAQDSLIARSEWRSCPAKYSLSEQDVIEFAAKLNIAPQIVAGRLRRELRRYDIFSELVNEINVREVLFAKS